jgi:hypothetical protein
VSLSSEKAKKKNQKLDPALLGACRQRQYGCQRKLPETRGRRNKIEGGCIERECAYKNIGGRGNEEWKWGRRKNEVM